jgi:hypothetical protein
MWYMRQPRRDRQPPFRRGGWPAARELPVELPGRFRAASDFEP